jgi:hypothetical protein
VTVINGQNNSTTTIATEMTSDPRYSSFNLIDIAINLKTNNVYLINRRVNLFFS